MKIKLVTIFIILNSLLFSQTSVDMEHVFTFSLGDDPEQLALESSLFDTEIPYAPISLQIYKDIIYINDTRNGRISSFDLSGKFIDTCSLNEDSGYLMDSYYFFVSDLFFILLSQNSGVVWVDRKAKDVSQIGFNNYQSQILSKRNVFIIEDKIFLYNDRKEYELYNSVGELLSPETHSDYYEYISDESLRTLLEDNDVETLNGVVMSNNFKLYRSIFETIGDLNNEYDTFSLEENNVRVRKFIGRDDSLNIYWEGMKGLNERWIIITSPQGNVISAFMNPLKNARFAVSSSGDLYYLKTSLDGISLWKTERNW